LAAWVMVTFVGLLLAPVAVIVTCPVRGTPVFSMQKTRITPLFPPDEPLVILSQLEPAEMLAA
jgi:hypothetical protein